MGFYRKGKCSDSRYGEDKGILETDAPYLTPVPERGTVNTPLKVRYVYKAAAEFIGTSEEALCGLVYANALEAFSLQMQG